MPREINEILRELNDIAENLDSLAYVHEASDLRSMTETVRTGGTVELRVRKARVLPEDTPIRTTATKLSEFERMYRHIPGFRGAKFVGDNLEVRLTEDADKYLFPKMFAGTEVKLVFEENPQR